MNHINVVLQSLYPLFPLRAAVFQSSTDYHRSSPISSSTDPLELVFAKIYYDSENEKGATDSSIYFKDSYLITEGSIGGGTPLSISSVIVDLNTPTSPYLSATSNALDYSPPSTSPSTPNYSAIPNEPIKFFHWLTRELFKDSKYRDLMQLELTTIHQSENDEKSVDNYFDIFVIPVEETLSSLSIPQSRTYSIQSYLDEFFASRAETFSVTIDGVRQDKSREIFKELINSPEILPFLITESGIAIDPLVTLPNENSYILVSVIYKDQNEYSAAYRSTDDSWIRLHDDEASQDISFDSFSQSVHMAFYMNSLCTESTAEPSHDLIMESLTRNIRHSITKTIKRQISNSPPIKSTGIPLKSKRMSNVHLNSLEQIAQTDTLEARGTSPRSKANQFVTLPTLPYKNSPSDDAEIAQQLKSILIPEDLSHVQMNLVTTGSFNQNDFIEDVHPKRSTVKGPTKKYNFEPEDEVDSSEFIDDDKMSTGKVDKIEDDLELDYFEEVQRKGPSIWEANYLNASSMKQFVHEHPEQKRSKKPASLMDFEIEFNPGNQRKDPFHDGSTVIDEEVFKRTARAKISKSRGNLNNIFEDPIDLKPLSLKTLSSKPPSVQSVLSSGLFYRARTSLTAGLPASKDEKKIASSSSNSDGSSKFNIKNTYSKL